MKKLKNVKFIRLYKHGGVVAVIEKNVFVTAVKTRKEIKGIDLGKISRIEMKFLVEDLEKDKLL